MRLAIALLVLAACTPQPSPVPPPVPDASDASFAADSPNPCVQACAAMVAAGCPQGANCPTALGNVEAHRLVANPANSGQALQCKDLLSVKTAADVAARGWSCGP